MTKQEYFDERDRTNSEIEDFEERYGDIIHKHAKLIAHRDAIYSNIEEKKWREGGYFKDDSDKAVTYYLHIKEIQGRYLLCYNLLKIYHYHDIWSGNIENGCYYEDCYDRLKEITQKEFDEAANGLPVTIVKC